jgi:phage terminase large subunit-like protein
MKKVYDCAVAVGVKKDGKKVWKTVGALMENEKGKFLMLDKIFNPAGVESEGRSSILISLFEPSDEKKEDGIPF